RVFEYLIITSLFFFLSQSLSKKKIGLGFIVLGMMIIYVCGEFEGDVVWLDTITLLYVFSYSLSRLMSITNKLNTYIQDVKRE
uniref:Uncharacterized protein n=1 Tax=Solanum lycopersicum TaxID=4081 RepID=A0A3Q7EQK0_SOLLC